MELADEARPMRGTDETLQRRIAAYYDSTQILYSLLWSRTGVHYGLWENGTRRRSEAIRNLDRHVAARLALRPGSRVLDAGCGVGGTSTYLAEAHGLEVVGITLSRYQLERAQRFAAKRSAACRPTFEIRDYLNTGFSDASFDGVVAIESSCYAEPKRQFLCEAFRLLKPGGRLVVADGFIAARPAETGERDYSRMLEGMALTSLSTVNDFFRDLLSVGFSDVSSEDKRKAILPSARQIELLSYAGVVVCKVGHRLRLLPRTWLLHGLAGISQRRLFASGAVTYRVFTACKGGALSFA